MVPRITSLFRTSSGGDLTPPYEQRAGSSEATTAQHLLIILLVPAPRMFTFLLLGQEGVFEFFE